MDTELKKELHLRKAEADKQARTKIVNHFKDDETTKVVCFELNHKPHF